MRGSLPHIKIFTLCLAFTVSQSGCHNKELIVSGKESDNVVQDSQDDWLREFDRRVGESFSAVNSNYENLVIKVQKLSIIFESETSSQPSIATIWVHVNPYDVEVEPDVIKAVRKIMSDNNIGLVYFRMYTDLDSTSTLVLRMNFSRNQKGAIEEFVLEKNL